MIFEWNDRKERLNRIKHKVGFDLAPAFDFANALISIDDDLIYGEERLKATGVIGADVYVLVYVERGDVIRVISLRKATRKEVRDYVES